MTTPEQTTRAPLPKSQRALPLATDGWTDRYPRAAAHYERLCAHEAFAPDVGPYLEKIAKRKGPFD